MCLNTIRKKRKEKLMKPVAISPKDIASFKKSFGRPVTAAITDDWPK
jgi:hypothetical protein